MKGIRGIRCGPSRQLVLNHCNKRCKYWEKCLKKCQAKIITKELLMAIYEGKKTDYQ